MRKIFSAALALVCIWFATPAFANCNLFDGQIEKGSIDLNNGSVLVDNEDRTRSKNFIAVQPNTQYVFTRENTNGIRWIVGYDKDKNPITDSDFDRQHLSAIKNMADGKANSTTFTTTPTTYYIRWYNTSNSGLSEKVQIEKGSTATEYTPYNPLCATCNGTIVNYTSATGTVSQSGTPTPDNPIEPTFYKQGDMVLRKVGDYADSYDATTGKITRRVGVKVLDGTESWTQLPSPQDRGFYTIIPAIANIPYNNTIKLLCTHFNFQYWENQGTTVMNDNCFSPNAGSGICNGNITFHPNMSTFDTVDKFKQFLASQYANGTPVTIYYPLETETTEDWTETSYCETPIKIATTKYNETKFSPLNTALANAISVVDTVVSNTITQAGRIATLQTQKQTRPNDIADDNEKCPAGKKCLLVEDASGIPHWYEIVENAWDLPAGYTQLQYIESTGTQYIDTNITGSTNAIIDMQGTPRTDDTIVFMLAPIDATAFQNGFGQYQSTMTGSFDIATRRVYNVSYTSSSMTVNDVNVSNRYIANNVNLALFGSTATSRRIRNAKLYSAKIYNNDTLLRNFVPAQNSSGVVGMYDTVSGTFFENKGTGDFIGGDPVSE